MKRPSLYSSSPRSRAPRAPRAGISAPVAAPVPGVVVPEARTPGRLSGFVRRRQKPLLVLLGAAVASLLFALQASTTTPPRQLTQRDIDAAVLRTLETKPLPSRAAQAYELVRHAVVRVRGLGADDEKDKDEERSVGTGVVILDDGTILTNLHVVAGA